MKVFFVLDEGVYHPMFFSRFLSMTHDDVCGLAIVKSAPKKNSIERYFMKNFFRLYPSELFGLGMKKVFMKVMDLLAPGGLGGNFFSVKSTAEAQGIPYFYVEKNINKEEHLGRIRAHYPDVIVSSNPLIFKKEILELPSKACINRHSALLPAYGGMLPVFHAYKNGEGFTGVSIHTMEEEIDKGVVLASRRIRINYFANTLMQIYERCFELSADALLDALEAVRRGDYSDRSSGYEPSYYSKPTADDWKRFREKGGRII